MPGCVKSSLVNPVGLLHCLKTGDGNLGMIMYRCLHVCFGMHVSLFKYVCIYIHICFSVCVYVCMFIYVSFYEIFFF